MGSRYHPDLKSEHQCLSSKDWLFWNSTILEKKCNFLFSRIIFLRKIRDIEEKVNSFQFDEKIWEIQEKVNSFQFDKIILGLVSFPKNSGFRVNT